MDSNLFSHVLFQAGFIFLILSIYLACRKLLLHASPTKLRILRSEGQVEFLTTGKALRKPFGHVKVTEIDTRVMGISLSVGDAAFAVHLQVDRFGPGAERAAEHFADLSREEMGDLLRRELARAVADVAPQEEALLARVAPLAQSMGCKLFGIYPQSVRAHQPSRSAPPFLSHDAVEA